MIYHYNLTIFKSYCRQHNLRFYTFYLFYQGFVIFDFYKNNTNICQQFNAPKMSFSQNNNVEGAFAGISSLYVRLGELLHKFHFHFLILQNPYFCIFLYPFTSVYVDAVQINLLDTE